MDDGKISLILVNISGLYVERSVVKSFCHMRMIIYFTLD